MKENNPLGGKRTGGKRALGGKELATQEDCFLSSIESPVLSPPKLESVQAAEDWNMVAIGVNSCAYFSTEAFCGALR